MKEILIAVIGSEVATVLITALINAWTNRKSRLKAVEQKLDHIEQKLNRSEKDELRTQLLLMLSDYPDEVGEIMTLAQHYFGDLEGNWYASSLFNKWLLQYQITKPLWFSEGEK